MIQRIDAGNRMSEATVHGGIAWLAGQVPETGDAGIEVQTAEVLAAIDEALGDVVISDPALVAQSTPTERPC